MTSDEICGPGHAFVAGVCQPTPTPAGRPPTTTPDVGGPWAVGGFCLAALLIAIGVAGVLFPKKTPRRWGQ